MSQPAMQTCYTCPERDPKAFLFPEAPVCRHCSANGRVDEAYRLRDEQVSLDRIKTDFQQLSEQVAKHGERLANIECDNERVRQGLHELSKAIDNLLKPIEDEP